jgi:hypothetical protein
MTVLPAQQKVPYDIANPYHLTQPMDLDGQPPGNLGASAVAGWPFYHGVGDLLDDIPRPIYLAIGNSSQTDIWG